MYVWLCVMFWQSQQQHPRIGRMFGRLVVLIVHARNKG